MSKSIFRTLTVTVETTEGRRTSSEMLVSASDNLVQLMLEQFELARHLKQTVVSASVEKLTAADRKAVAQAYHQRYASVTLIRL